MTEANYPYRHTHHRVFYGRESVEFGAVIVLYAMMYP